LEYLDALLGRGAARFPDVAVHLARTAKDRLRATGMDIEAYLAAYDTLDAALAEVATLAADDVLLDRLLDGVAHLPQAHRLLLGASVYRRPVNRDALLFQLGTPQPEPDPDPIPDPDPGSGQAPAGARPTPPLSVTVDVAALVRALAATSLLAVEPVDGEARTFVHRWTATELARRHTDRGQVDEVIDAHRRAAGYWRWRVRVWPQSRESDVEDLREAHHHLDAAAALGHAASRPKLAGCSSIAWHRLAAKRGSNIGNCLNPRIYWRHKTGFAELVNL
jgi:hypothetical protein